nr:MAG TPA_asm: hypothetical protein [Caudoviricetes sp.]
MFCLYTLVPNFCIIQVSNEAQKARKITWKRNIDL